MKIQEVIDQICKWHEPFEEHGPGRDKVLAGNPDQECTGIVITCCATYDVLKKAKELGANFIVSHESIFYGSQLDVEVLKKNEVYNSKKQFIDDNGLVVWRDHDRMHGNGLPFQTVRHNPDYIFYGICKELGWEEYVVGDKKKPLWYKIPTVSARELANQLMEKFNLKGLRVVGNLDAEVSTVWFCEHINGGKFDGDKVKNGIDADVMIPLEICDYTLTQYVNDAVSMGKSKVILEMGHFNCEELGMKYMTEWIKEALSEEIKVDFVQCGDFFEYISAK